MPKTLEDAEKARQRYAGYDEAYYLKLNKGTNLFNIVASLAVISCVMQDWKVAAVGVATSVAVSTFMGMRFADRARETREPYYSPRMVHYKKAKELLPVVGL